VAANIAVSEVLRPLWNYVHCHGSFRRKRPWPTKTNKSPRGRVEWVNELRADQPFLESESVFWNPNLTFVADVVPFGNQLYNSVTTGDLSGGKFN
jgi:hypothetical protein